MSSQAQAISSSTSAPLFRLPAELQAISTPSGSVEFIAVDGVVHGEKVYTTSDTRGGSDHNVVTGHTSVSIHTDVSVYTEFWVRPHNGGRDHFVKLKNHEFRVSNGQNVSLIFAKGKTVFSEPLMLLNLDSREALELPDQGAGKHVQDDLVGAAKEGSLMMVGIAMIAVGALAYLVTGSIGIALAAFAVAVVLGGVIGSKSSSLNAAVANQSAREVVEKAFTRGYAALRKELTDTAAFRWPKQN